MSEKLRNIIEDIAQDYLQSALTLRYDICTCAVCKNDMLAYILSHVPAKYVTTQEGAMHTIIQQTRVEHQAQIARAILQAIELVGNNPRHQIKEDKNKTFALLLDKIREDRSLDFRHYHQDLLRRRVAVRIRTLKLATYADYLRYLINHPEEYDKLFEVLCINVSEFFRDPEVWVAVKRVLEEMIRAKKKENSHSLKIWSAGCASGEEAHTIAIILRELLGPGMSDFQIQIHATDVDKKVMDAAGKGVYGKESLKNVDKKLLEKYFAGKDGSWTVSAEIHNLITVAYLDLTSTELIENADIVFCRNVFIYFDRNLQEQILMKFYQSLKPEGYLVMGKSESMIRDVKSIFQEIDFDSRLYKKIPSP
ncbi:MAG TPA: CheR family methyltransferase [Candidatus Omnitrophota bacterium]|nr:CheR family methyltransferase [Candidatus Omnitrophota bacterium]